jgi:hypothetical protein
MTVPGKTTVLRMAITGSTSGRGGRPSAFPVSSVAARAIGLVHGSAGLGWGPLDRHFSYDGRTRLNRSVDWRRRRNAKTGIDRAANMLDKGMLNTSPVIGTAKRKIETHNVTIKI